MEINVNRRHLEGRPGATMLFDLFQAHSKDLLNSVILFDFPIYKDFDGAAVSVQVKRHSYLTLAPFSMSRARGSERWHCDSSSQ
jgi:hypothetical protein